jgi:hypothetical protein
MLEFMIKEISLGEIISTMFSGIVLVACVVRRLLTQKPLGQFNIVWSRFLNQFFKSSEPKRPDSKNQYYEKHNNFFNNCNFLFGRFS